MNADLAIDTPASRRRPGPRHGTLRPVSVVSLVVLHAAAVVAVWAIATGRVDGRTLILAAAWYVASGLSITAGYHRLFAHRSYTARGPLRWVFVLVGAGCMQHSVIRWCSDHRAHHRFPDTDRDPYSITDGFWWAHFGWLFFNRPSTSGGSVGDLEADPLLRAQHRYYPLFMLASGVGAPALVAAIWGDPLGGALVAGVLRAVVLLQATCCVNSVAHRFGRRPVASRTSATDSGWLALVTFGEGYHNRHHARPNDHRFGPRPWQWDPGKWLIWLTTRARLSSTFRGDPSISPVGPMTTGEVSARQAT